MGSREGALSQSGHLTELRKASSPSLRVSGLPSLPARSPPILADENQRAGKNLESPLPSLCRSGLRKPSDLTVWPEQALGHHGPRSPPMKGKGRMLVTRARSGSKFQSASFPALLRSTCPLWVLGVPDWHFLKLISERLPPLWPLL